MNNKDNHNGSNNNGWNNHYDGCKSSIYILRVTNRFLIRLKAQYNVLIFMSGTWNLAH